MRDREILRETETRRKKERKGQNTHKRERGLCQEISPQFSLSKMWAVCSVLVGGCLLSVVWNRGPIYRLNLKDNVKYS
jgi:hypothetical protein